MILADTGFPPPGLHYLTVTEFVREFCTNRRRQRLWDAFVPALGLLREAGCKEVVLAGSFVSDAPRPGDIDALWISDGVESGRLIELCEPIASQDREELRRRFSADLLPADWHSASGQLALRFFQETRAGEPRGVAVIDLTTLD